MNVMKPNSIPQALPLPELWRMQAGALPTPDVLTVLLSILRTLGAWYEHGRCHGSLSLSSIQRSRNGDVLVLPPVGSTTLVHPEQEGFAAFECYGNTEPDSPMDVYAVSAIGWSLLTGARPPSALVRAVQDPDSLGALDVAVLHQPDHQPLGKVLLRGLAFFPEDRYASVQELEAAVQACMPVAEPVIPVPAVPEPVLPEPVLSESISSEPASLEPSLALDVSDNGVVDSHASVAEPQVAYATHQATTPEKKEQGRAPLSLILAVVVLALGVGIYWLQSDPEAVEQPEETTQMATPDALPAESSNLAGNQNEPAPQISEPSVSAAEEPLTDTEPAAIETDPVVSTLPEETAAQDPVQENDAGISAETSVDDEQALASADETTEVPAEEHGDAETKPEPEPEAKPAAVTVNLSIAPWAEVYVNGVRKGVSPPMRTLSLTPGSYQIELRNGSDAPKKMQLRVQAGKPATLSHRFE